jgi:hypothetical protein
MNGRQIENLLQLIDGNIDLTRSEAAEYIRVHQAQIVDSLAKTGTAIVVTSAGEIVLSERDLYASAG